MKASAALDAATPFIAVDGGNSKTDVVIGDTKGSVLAAARGGASGHQMVGLEAAMEAIKATIDEAHRISRTSVSTPAHLGVFCLAGLDLPIDERQLSEALERQRLVNDVVLHNDTIAVLRAGASKGWGVGVVCGTGLNCAGLGPDGASVRFPSLGELSGDLAAGGAWLGMRGLGLALRARDGRGERSALEHTIPAHFGYQTPEAVLEALYSGELSYGRLPELAKVVLDTADQHNDGPAGDAATFLGSEVIAMAAAAIKRLKLSDQAVEVVLGGGVFATRYRQFIEQVHDGIQLVAPSATFPVLHGPPVLGAAYLALDTLEAPPEAYRRLRDALGRAFTPSDESAQ